MKNKLKLIENKILTVKDLRRGGTWEDSNLNDCYNPGVPCRQFNLTNPLNRETIKEYKDATVKVRDLI